MAVFDDAEFTGGEVNFRYAQVSGGAVFFGGAKFSEDTTIRFEDAKFSGGPVSFRKTGLIGGTIRFDRAEFSGGTLSFDRARFSGSEVRFVNTKFSGGEVNFSNVGDWSCPPTFPWADTPPPGVKLLSSKINPRLRHARDPWLNIRSEASRKLSHIAVVYPPDGLPGLRPDRRADSISDGIPSPAAAEQRRQQFIRSCTMELASSCYRSRSFLRRGEPRAAPKCSSHSAPDRPLPTSIALYQERKDLQRPRRH